MSASSARKPRCGESDGARVPFGCQTEASNRLTGFSMQLVVLGPLTCKREHTFAPRRPYCTENRRPRSPAQLSSTALSVSGPKHLGWPES